MTEAILDFAAVSLVAEGVRVFDDLSFSLSKGERVAILGDSGTGKSLILRLAAGLMLPSSGAVSLLGQDLADLNGDALRRVRTRCGFVVQSGSLLGDLTVEENLWLALGVAPTARPRLRRRLDRLMLIFRIEDSGGRTVNALSAGERRRVELARAFLREPELLILDEPFDGAAAAAALLETQVRTLIVPRGRALLLLTQDVSLARRLCQRLYRLERGRLQQLDEAAPADAPAALS